MFNHQSRNGIQRERYANYRHVSSTEMNGALRVEIDPVDACGFYVVWLAVISAVFVGGCWVFAPALVRISTWTELSAILLVAVFLLSWSWIGIRIALQRLSHIELFVGRGSFRLSYWILRWRRDIEVRIEDVSAVESEIKWYGNKLSITVGGKTYVLGDLFKDDLMIVAGQLRKVLPCRSVGIVGS